MKRLGLLGLIGSVVIGLGVLSSYGNLKSIETRIPERAKPVSVSEILAEPEKYVYQDGSFAIYGYFAGGISTNNYWLSPNRNQDEEQIVVLDRLSDNLLVDIKKSVARNGRFPLMRVVGKARLSLLSYGSGVDRKQVIGFRPDNSLGAQSVVGD